MSMSWSLRFLQTANTLKVQWSERGKLIKSYGASRRSGDRTVTFGLVKEKPSDLETESAILQSKEVIYPARIRTNGL